MPHCDTIERSADDRAAAFASDLQACRSELVAYARRLLDGDHAAAEDVVQDAFIATSRALRDEPHRELLPRPWLYRLVHNGAIDELRTARRRRVTLGSPVPEDSGLDPCGVLTERAALHDTLARVAALPARQREALILHAVHGLDHGRVSSTLGITRDASRVLVHRARTTLRGGSSVVPHADVRRTADGLEPVAP